MRAAIMNQQAVTISADRSSNSRSSHLHTPTNCSCMVDEHENKMSMIHFAAESYTAAVMPSLKSQIMTIVKVIDLKKKYSEAGLKEKGK